MVTYWDCVEAACANQDLVKEFDRLNGTNLSLGGSGLDLEIDKVTGHLEAAAAQFLNFVWECIYMRLPNEERA